MNIYKNISDKVKQPYAYLVKNLQDNEIEIFKLKNEIKKKDNQINKLNKENEIYQEKINNLSNDLKTIVNNRQKLYDLENVINSYMNNNSVDNTNENSMNVFNNNNNNNETSNFKSSYFNNSQQFPERDTNSQKIPNWYLSLKSKKLQ